MLWLIRRNHLERRSPRGDKYWLQFREQHDEILEPVDDETEDLSKMYFEQGTHDNIETAYSENLGNLYETLEKFDTANQAGNSAASSLKQRLNELSARHTINIKTLGYLELPAFSGDFKSWTSFNDLFQSLVIKNTSLSDVEKFHHLKSSSLVMQKTYYASLLSRAITSLQPGLFCKRDLETKNFCSNPKWVDSCLYKKLHYLLLNLFLES